MLQPPPVLWRQRMRCGRQSGAPAVGRLDLVPRRGTSLHLGALARCPPLGRGQTRGSPRSYTNVATTADGRATSLLNAATPRGALAAVARTTPREAGRSCAALPWCPNPTASARASPSGPAALVDVAAFAPSPAACGCGPHAAGLPLLPLGPPSVGAIYIGQLWAQVTSAGTTRSDVGPEFCTPVEPSSSPSSAWSETVDCCFLEDSEHAYALEWSSPGW